MTPVNFNTWPNLTDGKTGFSFASNVDNVVNPQDLEVSFDVGPFASMTSTISGAEFKTLAVNSNANAGESRPGIRKGFGFSMNSICEDAGGENEPLDCAASLHSGEAGKVTRVAELWAKAAVIDSGSQMQVKTTHGFLIDCEFMPKLSCFQAAEVA